MRRTTLDTRTRRYVTAIGCLAAFSLTAGVAAAVARRDDGPSVLRPAAEQPSVPGDLLATPTLAPTALPTPSLPAPPTAPAPTAVPTALPTAPTAVPTGVPSLPVPTVTSPVPDITVSVTDPVLPTATKTHVVVRWRTGDDVSVRVDTDDGHAPLETGRCPMGPWFTAVENGAFTTASFEWSYRRAGTYTLRAELWREPCDSGSRPALAAYDTTTVVVTPGAVRSNGPWLPHVSARVVQPEDMNFSPDVPPYSYGLYYSQWDPDGWVSHYVIDWHDGSEPEAYSGFFEECVNTHYPDTTWPWGGATGGSTWHTLPGPGTYHVTVTAYSSDCEGNDVQTASAAATLTVPGS